MNHLRSLEAKELFEKSQPSNVAPANYYSTATAERPVPYLRILWRSKWLILLCAVTGALVGLAAVWRQPSVYQAHVELEVQGINENLLNARDLDPAATTDNLSQSYINTQARVLQSYPLFEQVAQRLNMGKATPPVTPKEVSDDIKVRTRETDRIVDIYAESNDPKRAAAIGNGLAEEFLAQDITSRWNASRRTSDWLNTELGSLSAKLTQSEQELQDFANHSNLLVDGEQGSVAETNLRQVEAELNRAQGDRISKEAALAGVKGSQHDANTVVTDNTLQQYQIQLTSLRKELAQLEATYAPDYYKIPPLKAQISELQRAVDQQRRDVLSQRDSEYQAALRREAMLQAQYAEQLKQATSQASKMVRYTALVKAVELNRTIYGEMLQKVKGYNVAKAMQVSNIRLIEPARAPARPVRPNKPLIAILSGMAFAFCGVCFTLARAIGNRSIREPGETQVYLRSPELGVIPSVKAKIPGYSRLPGNRSRAGRVKVVTSATREKLETAAWHQSPSLLAESFRSASASLLLSNSGGKRPRVIMVTSVNPSEGKTTVATNLGISLAGSIGRVLLIDADRHRARLHTVLERPNDRGLTDLLQSDSPIEEDYIVDTPIPNLYLLPNGKTHLKTPDLLYSATMEQLIERFRDRFDTVIVDTPPMLHLPDARILGRLSDGLILVLRAGRVRRESAIAVEQRLREDGINVLGTVLNDWDPDKNGYGVYPHDRRDYAYFDR
ncbi:MAG TPA: polysaccharide biosynthesis tyrosine autokinase [Bryobacteraceae bacterium]|nr:polysaccharide biosynthesis tyrosine autokinase [Bryobacteraceae bacterium]